MQPDIDHARRGDLPVISQRRPDLRGERAAQAFFPVADRDGLAGGVAEAQPHPHTAVPSVREHPCDFRLGLLVEGARHHQDSDVLASLGHEPRPRLAGHAGPVGVQAHQLGLCRAVPARGDGLRPQPAFLRAKPTGGVPPVRPVRDAPEGQPPLDGLDVHPTAERKILGGSPRS